MKVTIDGITYEGTPSEIRDIIENPPRQRQQASDRTDCPDNDRWNYPHRPPRNTNCDWEDWYWWGYPGSQRNWDGSPRFTCCAALPSNMLY